MGGGGHRGKGLNCQYFSPSSCIKLYTGTGLCKCHTIFIRLLMRECFPVILGHLLSMKGWCQQPVSTCKSITVIKVSRDWLRHLKQNLDIGYWNESVCWWWHQLAHVFQSNLQIAQDSFLLELVKKYLGLTYFFFAASWCLKIAWWSDLGNRWHVFPV